MTLRFLYIFLVLGIFVQCSDDMEMEDENIQPDIEITPPSGNENYLNLDSDYIFNDDKLHTFELTLSEANLQFLDRDPVAEEFVEGSLTFEGETVAQVGIRYKGSIGAFVNCLSGNDWANPSGRKTCTKLSMKVKFNWLDKDDKFYGLKKLQFHSMNLDESQMRDRLGYYLFREMGVPAPRATHARLVINGIYHGVYSMVEQIDGRFTRKNFEDGTGNLYKEVWPVSHDGRVQADQVYFEGLKTNEDEDPNFDLIKGFAGDIVASDDETIRSVITQWMNLDEIMAYVAVDRTIRADDGPFHWYCGGDECSNHNYYWYEDPSNEMMHLIPWDLDNAFENIVSNTNPVTPIADEWGQISAGCLPFSFGFFGLQQRSAACDKLTAGWASFADEYEMKRLELSRGPFSEENVSMLLDKWSEQIRSATQEADEQIDDAISLSEWEQALVQFKFALDFARL